MKIDRMNGNARIKGNRRKRGLGSISYGADIGINIFFILCSIICLLPIALVVVISFANESDIIQYGFSFIPREVNLNAYKFVMADARSVFSAYGVSLIVTIIGTICGCFITALYAYPLSRKDFLYRKKFAFFVAFTMLFNGGLVPWYMVYAKLLAIKNSYLVLILPLLVNGFNVLILRTFMMKNVPSELIDSAKIDGAGEFRTFFSIVLPLCMPGVATIALFLSLNYWNDWYNALLFIDEKELFPLQYFMYKVSASLDVLNTSNLISNASEGYTRPSESARMAMAIIGIGPIILVYPFLQKYFVKGLTVGSVKG